MVSVFIYRSYSLARPLVSSNMPGPCLVRRFARLLPLPFPIPQKFRDILQNNSGKIVFDGQCKNAMPDPQEYQISVQAAKEAHPPRSPIPAASARTKIVPQDSHACTRNAIICYVIRVVPCEDFGQS
jgi:hypothetical protein